MGVWAQAGSLTAGTGGRSTRRYDQCPFHFAPSSIQRRSVSISAGFSRGPASGGGITSSSVEVTRAIILLARLSPGTIACPPESSTATADSRSSSRRPACRFAWSGP